MVYTMLFEILQNFNFPIILYNFYFFYDEAHKHDGNVEIKASISEQFLHPHWDPKQQRSTH